MARAGGNCGVWGSLVLLVSSPLLRDLREGGREKARNYIPRDVGGRSLSQGLEETGVGGALPGGGKSSVFGGIRQALVHGYLARE